MLRAPPGETLRKSYNGHYMAVGKVAEKLVMELIQRDPLIVEVADLRDLRTMQRADVDFAITTADGRNVLAEVKSDYWMGISGNVCFEILRFNHTGPPESAAVLGWSARSPATWLFIYAPQKHAIYQCRVNALRHAVQRYTATARKDTEMRWVNTDAIKSTLTILVPWPYCEGIFRIHDLKAYGIAAPDGMQTGTQTPAARPHDPSGD